MTAPGRVGTAGAAVLGLVLVHLTAAPIAEARILYESDDGDYRLTLRTSLKASWLLSYPQDDLLLPEVGGGAAFFRLRSEVSTRLSSFFTLGVAYEHRALARSSAGLGGGVLPPSISPPFRLAALDWAIVDTDGYVHRHQLDRFYVALHLPFMELTVGRQAIGLGRGVLFSAIDVFSPFSPNEVDREWRGGVDAIHLELRIPELEVLSADVFAVFGAVSSPSGHDSLESYSVLGRIRGIVGDVDGEIVVGNRGEDTMVGGALSATVGDAEVHGELALFGTNGAGVDGGLFGTRGVVAKGVLGGSYNIDLLRGIRVVLEYHYSGFGVENVGHDASILLDAAYVSRALRGHSQTLGRHTLALALSTEVSDEVSIALSWFQSPVDGSGLLAPAMTWIASDLFTMVVTGLVPWGTTPAGGIPRSEWGSAPFTLFLQARLYD